jgi:hypothetical protein
MRKTEWRGWRLLQDAIQTPEKLQNAVSGCQMPPLPVAMK